MAITLKVGKYYKNRTGYIVGPTILGNKQFPFRIGDTYYLENGHCFSNKEDYKEDLMEEVQAPFKLQEGKYYLDRKNNIHGPLQKIDSDPYSFISNHWSWTEDGTWHLDKENCILDLVKEVTDFTIEDKKVHLTDPYQMFRKEQQDIPKSDVTSPGIDQVPFEGIEAIGAIFAEGEIKYGKDNWKKQPNNETYNAERLRHAIRHLYLYASGDRSEPHLAKVAWFCVTTIWREKHG